MDKVAIVILNWNGKKFLEQFLPNVIEKSKGARLIVADNCSSDDSIDFLKKNYPEIRIIQNPNNGGFSTGYNLALKQVEAEYYILLNSDIEVTDHWIEPVLKLMDSNPKIAACQPKLINFYNRKEFEYAGAAGGFIDYIGYPFCQGRLFNYCEEDHGQYNKSKPIFWATGACMFVRANEYHAIGGLDDHFFAHLEEIDLCWRLKSTGKEIWYCAESTVFHVGGGTLNKVNPRKTYLNFRNSLFMLLKNLDSKKVYPILFLRLLLDGVAGAKFLFEGSPNHTWAVLRAHFSFYRHFGIMRAKRKSMAKHNLNFPEVYQGSIVYQFYINKKRKIFS